MTEKPDCYKCQHRGDIPGDTHSSCHHPAFEALNKDPHMKLLAILGSVRRSPPIQVLNNDIIVKGNPIGIKGGWFNHPFNFDPLWLEYCTGFKEKI